MVCIQIPSHFPGTFIGLVCGVDALVRKDALEFSKPFLSVFVAVIPNLTSPTVVVKPSCTSEFRQVRVDEFHREFLLLFIRDSTFSVRDELIEPRRVRVVVVLEEIDDFAAQMMRQFIQ